MALPQQRKDLSVVSLYKVRKIPNLHTPDLACYFNFENRICKKTQETCKNFSDHMKYIIHLFLLFMVLKHSKCFKANHWFAVFDSFWHLYVAMHFAFTRYGDFLILFVQFIGFVEMLGVGGSSETNYLFEGGPCENIHLVDWGGILHFFKWC